MRHDPSNPTNNQSPLCRAGHEMIGDNVRIVLKTGKPACRECNRLRNRGRSDRIVFGGNREIAIKRDGEKCVKCGMTRKEHQEKYRRDISVDHIDGMGTYTPAELRNNDLSNLQTLCISCHSTKDGPRHMTERAKLSHDDVRRIRTLAREGMSWWNIAKQYPVTDEAIKQVVQRRIYKYVTDVKERVEAS